MGSSSPRSRPARVRPVPAATAHDLAEAEAATAERPRPGRPRSEACGRAIETAALELLVEDGFGRMSIEGVAARAGVGKATIYRRWATKEELVVDAVRHTCLDHAVTPDTGSLRADLAELYRALLEKFQRDGDIMRAFAAEHGRHPELAEAFRATFLSERRAIAQDMLRRGVARGELPADSDIELLADVGPALLWHRVTISGLPLDDDLGDRIISQFFPSPGP
jgi:AcrR family transcriptional regulator